MRPQDGVVQAQGRQYAGREVFHQRIGVGEQLQQDGAPGFRFEIEGDAALAAVEIEERQALFGVWFVVVKGRQPAGRVAAGPFNFEDVRAEIGQQFGGVGAGDVVSQVDDLDAGQGCASQGNNAPGGKCSG